MLMDKTGSHSLLGKAGDVLTESGWVKRGGRVLPWKDC